MARMRATPLLIIRGMIKARGIEFENKYLAQLTEEEKNLYKNSLPIHWIAMPLGNQTIITKAAKLLYPKLPNEIAYQQLSREMVKKFIPIFFRIFLQLHSVPALLKKQQTFWKYIFDRGKIELSSQSEKKAVMILHEFEDLPATQRDFLNGLYIGFAELGGGKNVHVKRSDDDPAAWTWTINWE